MKRLTFTLACLLAPVVAACTNRPIDDETDDGDDSAELLWWSGGYTAIIQMSGGMKQAQRFILDSSGSMLYEVEDCHDLYSQKAGRWELAADGATVVLLNAAGTAPFSILNNVEDGDVQWYLTRVIEDGECMVSVTDGAGLDLRYERGALCLAEGLTCLEEDLELATTWCEGEPPELLPCP
jgi:hypothetical protein